MSGNSTDSQKSILDAARTLLLAGLCVIPVRCDGSKAAAVKWKIYEQRCPTEAEVDSLFVGHVGIAVVCGKVSNNLENIDIDDQAVIGPWKDLVEEASPGLLARLPQVRTPSDCLHVWYRCSSIGGNQKLARVEEMHPETGKPTVRTLIETRGEGGYALIPPSPPECHELNLPYVHVAGPSLTVIPEISPEQREILISAARSLNRFCKRQESGVRHAQSPNGGTRPGDAFNARGPAWDDVLTPHGWTAVRQTRGITYWRRPGKDGPGCSATTGACGDKLYVFTTNAHPFEAETAYTKFAAHALLNHDGDYAAAARALAQKGYGQKTPATSIEAQTSAGTADAPGPVGSNPGPVPIQDLLKLLEAAGEVEVVPAVLPCLPEGVGHAAGRITVIGAFTGGGKTSLCTAEAVHLAALSHPVLLVTAELSGLEYARRIAQACDGDVGTLPIAVLEVRGDLGVVLQTIETWHQPLDADKAPVVIVDYLQRLRVVGTSSREREVAECAERLQELSRKLGVIVIAAAQLNRQSQGETRPALHHFRESGLIEQVADLAILIGQTSSDRMYAIVGKNRWGAGAGKEVEFSADYARCRFGALSEAQVIEPLVRSVKEYLKGCGGKALLKDVCKNAGSGVRGKHPRQKEVIEAARLSGAFRIDRDQVVLT